MKNLAWLPFRWVTPVVLIAIALGQADGQTTQAPIPPIWLGGSLTLHSEYNTGRSLLSPKIAPQPEIWLSVSAVPRDRNKQPVSSQTVQFSVSDPTKLVLSAPSAVSDDRALATVQVRGNGHAGTYTVTATWGTLTKTISIQLLRDPCTTENDSPHKDPPSVPSYPDPCAIRWKYLGMERVFLDQTKTAMTKWETTGRVRFVETQAGEIDLQFLDVCVPDGTWYAITRGTYRIEYNKWHMDGNPKHADENCRSDYPRASDRHHIVKTAAHEIGHALGFRPGHNTRDRAALMYGGPDPYFVCGTEAPTPDETRPLPNMGYAICP